jgi:catechol 2,3-dioxygenase-like lactoylglutathione lyase family enzyme
MPPPLAIECLHHVGRRTRRLEESLAFYRDVLGFRPIERPNFDFPGAWLFNYGIQVHLIVNEQAPGPGGEIGTRVDHLALRVPDIDQAERLLQAHKIAYRTNRVARTGVKQLFFLDPDGHHIELASYPPTPAYLDEARGASGA